MKNMKINLTLAFCLISIAINAQMTVIYECGNGTSNNILDDFSRSDSYFGVLNNPNIPSGKNIFSHNGNGVDYTFLYPGYDEGLFRLNRTIDQMHLYSDLEFYIEYQVNDTSNHLSLMSSNNSAGTSVPGTSGNIIATDVVSSVKIPYTNAYLDSILKIELDIVQTDSVLLQINYISVSADLSSIVSIDDVNTIKKELLVYADDSQIHVLNKGTKAYEVNVFSLTGQNVFSEKGDESLQINLNHPSGIYIVQIMRDGQYYSQKVFLNN